MSDHLATVQLERARYPAPVYVAGKLTNPLGDEHAYRITHAVAVTHHDEGWGLLQKTWGMHYNDCAIDILVNPRTREAVDCLVNSETTGIPCWSPIEYLPEFDTRWVDPFGPGPEPPIPPAPPAPAPPEAGYKLASRNGAYSALMQDDGNLVVYFRGRPIWASGSTQK